MDTDTSSYSKRVEEILRELGTDLRVGLSEAQAQDRSEGLGFLSGARDGARYAFSVPPAEPGAPFIAEHHAGGSIVVLRRSSDTWSLNGRASRTELSWSPVVARPAASAKLISASGWGWSYLPAHPAS